MLAGLLLVVYIISIQPLLGIALVGIVLSAILAHFFPVTTLTLAILLGQVAETELSKVLGIDSKGFHFGSAWVRLTDPLVAGMVISMAIRLFNEAGLLSKFLRGPALLFTFFLAFLFLQVLRNIPSFGMAAPGEFRTYYQFFLLLPYVSFSVRSSADRARLYKVLIALAFSFVLWGFIRAWLIFHFHFAPYDKWLSGTGSLTLLYGLFSLYLAQREGQVKLPAPVLYSLYWIGITMILIASTRAVWLAGGVGMITVWIGNRSSTGKNLKTLLLIPLFVLLLIPIFQYSGLDIIEFIRLRLVAFTDFQSDPTALWRFRYWLATIDQIIQHPWFGSGFGKDFGIYIPEFKTIETTSPHNLYLAVVYQIGFIGFASYLAWVIALGVHLKRSRPLAGIDQAVVSLAGLILITIHAYGIAYSFERLFLPWTFVGLAFSYLQNEKTALDIVPTLEEITP